MSYLPYIDNYCFFYVEYTLSLSCTPVKQYIDVSIFLKTVKGMALLLVNVFM